MQTRNLPKKWYRLPSSTSLSGTLLNDQLVVTKKIEAQINTNRKKRPSPPSAMDQKQNTPSSMPNSWVSNSEAMARRARFAGRQTATVVDFAHSSQRAST